MIRYLFKRALEMVPTLFGITLISFLILHLAPGKPTDVLSDFNPKITPEARERLEKMYNLDKPIVVQYGLWLKKIVKLDFGESFSTDRRPVIDKIWDRKQPLFDRRLFITFMLNLITMVIILAIAIPLGISSATHQYSLYDKITTTFVFIGFAIPSFWLALLLMMFFGIHLDLLPLSGLKSMNYDSLSLAGKVLDRIKHLLLPVFVSAFTGLAGDSRYMRSSMLEVIRQDYITVARAKGLPEKKVIYNHALKNALLPLITLVGLSVPGLIGGSVIMESIFGIPGMGQLFFMSVMTRDYPMVMSLLTIGGVLTLAGNLLADIGYMLADPRIRAKQ
jgi:peptide/nickel transport system permease protein